MLDWQALSLSLQLATCTALLLLPLAVWLARRLAWSRFRGQGAVEAAILLPLVLPPTVLGYYLLLGLGGASPLGQAYHALTGRGLVFSFDGLLFASLIFNVPFAVQPMRRFHAKCAKPRGSPACRAGRPSCRSNCRWRGQELPLPWHSLSRTPSANSASC
jgi:molybdate transport system permease protein